MKTDAEKAKIRQAYLDGNQKRNADGDRLWWIIGRDYYKPDEDHPFKLWECETAEGPTITAMRFLDTGKCTIQVNDGSPERSDACAARFVLDMEWNDFVCNWDFVK